MKVHARGILIFPVNYVHYKQSACDYFSSSFEICVHMCIYIVISVYICTYSAVSKNGDIICHN